MEYIHEQTFDGTENNDFILVKGEYESCQFKNCDLQKMDLSGMVFIDAHFTECNLSNVRIENASFQDAVFVDCKMMGMQFDTCKPFGFSPSFENCMLNHSVFFEMNLSRSSFLNCLLHDVDFSAAEMKNVELRECDLLNAKFDRTNLVKADFTKAIRYTIDPELNSIQGAKFSLPEAMTLLAKYKLQIE